jgi:hypothetical protein
MLPSPYPTHPRPEAYLQLLHGRRVASCATCGVQLTTARTQARCERRSRRRASPVCSEVI